jgi:hypothetical protein
VRVSAQNEVIDIAGSQDGHAASLEPYGLIMRPIFALSIILCCAFQTAVAEPVTLNNIERAETDTAMRGTLKMTGGLNKFVHLRQPTPIDKQAIIRMNRDTLYSAVVLDLSKPVTVILPETGDRYLSMHAINQDHYMYVVTKPGSYRSPRKKSARAMHSLRSGLLSTPTIPRTSRKPVRYRTRSR